MASVYHPAAKPAQQHGIGSHPMIVAVLAATAGALTARLFDRWLLGERETKVSAREAELERKLARVLPQQAAAAPAPAPRIDTPFLGVDDF